MKDKQLNFVKSHGFACEKKHVFKCNLAITLKMKYSFFWVVSRPTGSKAFYYSSFALWHSIF